MKLITDINLIHQNNGGNPVPRPNGLIDHTYSSGYALMLSDGQHDGICFGGYETKEDAILAAHDGGKIPDGYRLYLLSQNGRDPRNPDHIYWALHGEFAE